MNITIERTFGEKAHLDFYGATYGSTLLEVDMSEELIQIIKEKETQGEGEYEMLWMSDETIEMFKDEIGISPWNIGSICIDDEWYYLDTAHEDLWIRGYFKSDVRSGRQYEEITEEGMELYREQPGRKEAQIEADERMKDSYMEGGF